MAIDVKGFSNSGAGVFNNWDVGGDRGFSAQAALFQKMLAEEDAGGAAVKQPQQRYAFDFSGQPQTQTDAAPEVRDPAPLPSQPGSNIWKWLRGGGIVGLGALGAEYLGNLPAPLKEGEENIAPDLSLRVYGEGRTGPHGETAGFYKKDADGQERLLAVPVARLKTEVRPGEPLTGLVKFDGAALERAYGGKLSPDARARLGLPAEAEQSQPALTEVGGAGLKPPAGNGVRTDGDCDDWAMKNAPKDRLPRSNGEWKSGEPGNGDWYSTRPEVNAITGGEPISFTNGQPNFTPWAKFSVNFAPGELTGNHKQDVAKMIDKLSSGDNPVFKDKAAADEFMRENKLTPHHASDTCLQLVPFDLNNLIPHAGSASALRSK